MNTETIILIISIILFYSLLWTSIIIIILKAIENINEKKDKENETVPKEEKEIQLSLKLDDKENNSKKEAQIKKEKQNKIPSKNIDTKNNSVKEAINNKKQTKDKEKTENIKENKNKEQTKQDETTKKENSLNKTYIPKINENTNQTTKDKSRKIAYIIDYINESEFRKKERAIKKYNMLAYKKLLFEYYPNIREGIFNGDLIKYNENEQTKKYELILPTDKTFRKVHGNIVLHYTVYLEQKTVLLETITPEDVLTEEHKKELTTYKGVMVSKSHKDLDMFKINLLNSMNKD